MRGPPRKLTATPEARRCPRRCRDPRWSSRQEAGESPSGSFDPRIHRVECYSCPRCLHSRRRCARRSPTSRCQGGRPGTAQDAARAAHPMDDAVKDSPSSGGTFLLHTPLSNAVHLRPRGALDLD
jgi:hypothetical protein